MIKHKSKKIEHNLYECKNPKRRQAINVCEHFAVVHHKGRWVVALTDNGKFKCNQTINRSHALNLINFLTDYINLVKPTDATALHASIKVSANRIKKNATELVAIALKD